MFLCSVCCLPMALFDGLKMPRNIFTASLHCLHILDTKNCPMVLTAGDSG